MFKGTHRTYSPFIRKVHVQRPMDYLWDMVRLPLFWTVMFQGPEAPSFSPRRTSRAMAIPGSWHPEQGVMPLPQIPHGDRNRRSWGPVPEHKPREPRSQPTTPSPRCLMRTTHRLLVPLPECGLLGPLPGYGPPRVTLGCCQGGTPRRTSRSLQCSQDSEGS